jgi:23S rRNA (uracil1939-C5)-methyltransferase
MGLTVTASAAGLDVAVTGGKPLDMALRQDLAALVEAHRLARLVWDAELVAQRDPPMQRFGTALVLPPPGAFLQATADGEAALLRHVLHTVGAARQVVDLFSGCGTFALPLSAQAQVHAVEGSDQMVAALADGWRRAGGLRRLTTEARDLFRRPLDPAELNRFDAVVIDPPRAGAEAQVRAIGDARVPVVAYVSCNPATFARDARTLCDAGLRLVDMQVVDQFRWSSHVELAAAFRRDHMDAGKQT